MSLNDAFTDRQLTDDGPGPESECPNSTYLKIDAAVYLKI